MLVMTMSRHLDPSLLWRLRRLIQQERFDIVHTHLLHADLYGTLAAKWAGVRDIISSKHNDDAFRHYKPIQWLNAILTRWHTRIIVISDWIGKFNYEVEGLPAEKIVRIHYGVQPETIRCHADPHFIRKEFALPAEVPIIGTIGRLTAQKGQIYLLQAVRQVAAEFPEVRLVLVGNGELRSELESQAYQLGIASNVIFTGYRADALKLLSGFDLFVFPSLWEGFGLVLLEAMALEKAIVASNVSAIPESVQNGKTGLLVPPKEAQALAKALVTLLGDPQLSRTMGKAGFQRLQTHFTVEKMVRETESLYNEILNIA